MAKSIKVIYKPEVERKVDKRKLLREERNRLLQEGYRIKLRVDEITHLLNEPEDAKLEVTQHAVERFRQRIQNVPIQVAKKILSDPVLLQKYLKNGEGNHSVPSNPTVIAVIKNYTVVTCFSKADASTKLQDLEKYMMYYIDNLVNKVSNNLDYKINTFRQFRKTLYQ